MIDRRTLLGTALAAGALPAVAVTAQPAAPDDIPWPPREGFRLWPGAPPGAEAVLPKLRPEMRGAPGHRELQIRGVGTPMVYVFRPARPNGIGLIAMPGGGYEFLAGSNEGLNTARAFTALGYTVFVLIYRLPAEGWQRQSDVPLQDAQRAIRLVRAKAGDYGVDPRRVGIVGFSAGGHLAASLTTAFGEQVYAPVDDADQLSAKPVFSGLLYAVTTLRQPFTHQGTHDNLLGPSPSPALVDHRSPLLHIDAQTPPCFLVHALDDTVVPTECSIEWLTVCRARKVPVEAHILAHGNHGFGTTLPPSNPGSLWPQLFDRWIGEVLA